MKEINGLYANKEYREKRKRALEEAGMDEENLFTASLKAGVMVGVLYILGNLVLGLD